MNDRLDDRVEKMLKRIQRSRTEAQKALWYIAFTDTLLDLLQTKGAFTHEELRQELERRRQENADNAILSASYDEALFRLAEHAPR